MSAPDFGRYLRSLDSSKFRVLWPTQVSTLSEYADFHLETPHVGIELPTGSGKTLISLLIAGHWLSNRRKVAVLSANKTLARQMRKEAQELGVSAVYMEGRGADIKQADIRRYNRARAIAVMNYWVYFNQNPVVDPGDLVIMDDAHLAEHCLHSLYSVEITRTKHRKLFEAIYQEIHARFPDYSLVADALVGEDETRKAPELLSFIDQVEVSSRIQELIDSSEALASDLDFVFRWRRLREKFNTCNLYLGHGSIWLRPYIYPLTNNDHYSTAQQVIYLSATLGEPADLARRLGVRKMEKIGAGRSAEPAMSGRRLIVMNQTDDKQNIPARMSDALHCAIKASPKSLWLCTSEADAHKWRRALERWLDANGLDGHPKWMLTPLGDEIESFREAPRGHLFVAGRFDGMDFRGDECRIVVVTTLPRAVNLQEEFVVANLRDNDFMLRRLNQRIIQALGRCNRGQDDLAVYFLADVRFASYLARDSNRKTLSRQLNAEIDVAQDLTELDDRELQAYVEEFVGHKTDRFDRDLAAALEEVMVQASDAPRTDTSESEAVGWAALFDSENYGVASSMFRKCWDVAKAENLRQVAAMHGWYQAKALHLDGVRGNPASASRALDVVERAITRGGHTTWFNRMRASVYRAREDRPDLRTTTDESVEAVVCAFDDLLERLGTEGLRFQKYVDAISAKLESSRHDEFTSGLEALGGLVGYNARRPKHGAATDCIWRGEFGIRREYITFEAKIEHGSGSVLTASDLGQAHNQYSRAEEEFGTRDYAIRSAVVTHLELAEDAAASVGTIRLIKRQEMQGLWQGVALVLAAYRADWSLNNIAMRETAATALRRSLPKEGWLLGALDRAAPWLPNGLLTEAWRPG